MEFSPEYSMYLSPMRTAKLWKKIMGSSQQSIYEKDCGSFLSGTKNIIIYKQKARHT